MQKDSELRDPDQLRKQGKFREARFITTFQRLKYPQGAPQKMPAPKFEDENTQSVSITVR